MTHKHRCLALNSSLVRSPSATRLEPFPGSAQEEPEAGFPTSHVSQGCGRTI